MTGTRPDFPIPRHVALIMDGNGRWAKRGGKIRLRGHEAGVESVRDVVTAASEWGIEHLTLYAFSIENWSRPKLEVSGLMRFLKRFLKEERQLMLDKGIALRGLGQLSDLPDDVLAVLRETESATAGGTRMTLRLALSYGGRQEILTSMRALAKQVQDGTLQPNQIDDAALMSRMFDPEMPDPDLIIRTAGEIRLSNFLLWQASYAEFYFTHVLWPDFRREHLLTALREYDGRVRRFGAVLDDDPAVRPTTT